MKRFYFSVIAIVFACSVIQQFAPWWSIAVVAFMVGYMVKQKSWAAFFAGFTAVFFLWIFYAFMLSHANKDILAHKVADLLPLKGHVSLLLLLTGIIGGLVSGFGALSGRLAANLR